MNFTIIVVAMSLTLAGVTPSEAPQNSKTPSASTATLKISGMTCSACVKTLETAAKKVTGVTSVSVDYPKSVAQIAYDPSKTTPEEIARLLTRRSGMKAEVAKPAGK